LESSSPDYVFDEVGTVALPKTGVERAVAPGEYLLNFTVAWEKFKSLEMSFTDCTSIAVMRLHGIDKTLTFDRGFKRRG